LLEEPSPQLTKRFHEGSASPGEHPVLARWARVARLGLAADSTQYPNDTSSADLVSRRERLDFLFWERDGLLDEVADDLAAREVVALLADPDGFILASRGGGSFLKSAMNARLIEGAGWSEGARGTNAIGTALAEGRAVAVVGGAHYELRNTHLFCYARPIHDAYGRIAAILDVTGPMARHDSAFAVAVQTAGSALERTLRLRVFAQARPGGLPLLERLIERCREPALLIEATGVVRVTSEAMRAVLDPRGGAPLPRGQSVTCERVFGLSFERLAHLALTGAHGCRFETRGTSFGVDLDPLVGPDGQVLAIVVYLAVAAPKTPPWMRPWRVPQPSRPAFATLVGTDPAFLHAVALAQRFAETSLPVLLLAETGTGKELFARGIHAASSSSKGPFVAVNCAGLSASLLESELFGYAPGAFTGATRTGSEGKIAAAEGGVLFLDEVADMPEGLQSALLRVLDDGVFSRVGEARARKSNFRLVCATCRDLPALVDAGKFRLDLFYRIHGACVTIPPLRARSDKLLVAQALLRAIVAPDLHGAEARLSDDATAWIERHSWPGNVRELKSALVHAYALAGPSPITREHFPDVLVAGGSHTASPAEPTSKDLASQRYAAALQASSGNVAEAARQLGVARSTLYRALKR